MLRFLRWYHSHGNSNKMFTIRTPVTILCGITGVAFLAGLIYAYIKVGTALILFIAPHISANNLQGTLTFGPLALIILLLVFQFIGAVLMEFIFHRVGND